MVEELLRSFCYFECNSNCLFAIVRVKGRSKHVARVVAVASIAVAPLADFTPSPNTRNLEQRYECGWWIRTWFRSRPGKANQRKGQNEKFMKFAPIFVWILVCSSLGKQAHDSHIALLFRNAPAKNSWTDLSLVWFARGHSSPDWWWRPLNHTWRDHGSGNHSPRASGSQGVP